MSLGRDMFKSKQANHTVPNFLSKPIFSLFLASRNEKTVKKHIIWRKGSSVQWAPRILYHKSLLWSEQLAWLIFFWLWEGLLAMGVTRSSLLSNNGSQTFGNKVQTEARIPRHDFRIYIDMHP